MTRFDVLGASDVFVYVTDRSAACHCASVAVAPADVRVMTPVAMSYDAAMLPIVSPLLTNDNTSSVDW